jgi:hypothetical protein
LINAPNMDISIFDGRNPNLPKDDGPIGSHCASHLDQILGQRKPGQLGIRQILDSLPHLGLMVVPVPPGFDHRRFDMMQDCVVCLDGVLVWSVSFIEV